MSDSAVAQASTAELELEADDQTGRAYKISEHRYGKALVTLLAKDVPKQDGSSFSRKFFSVEKLYKKKGDEQWQSTSYFEPDELADLQLAVEDARRALHAK